MKKNTPSPDSDPRFAIHPRPNKHRASHDLSAWEEWVSEPEDQKRQRRIWPKILILLAGITVLGAIIASLWN